MTVLVWASYAMVWAFTLTVIAVKAGIECGWDRKPAPQPSELDLFIATITVSSFDRRHRTTRWALAAPVLGVSPIHVPGSQPRGPRIAPPPPTVPSGISIHSSKGTNA